MYMYMPTYVYLYCVMECNVKCVSSWACMLSCFRHVRLWDPMDCSPPDSSVRGILQVRTLEWVAISFSNEWKWKVKVKSLSRVRPSATPWTTAYQASPSMGFSRQEYWSGVPLPSLHLAYVYSTTHNHKMSVNNVTKLNYMKSIFFIV